MDYTDSLQSLDSCIKELVSDGCRVFKIPGASSSLDISLDENNVVEDLRPYIDPIRRVKSTNEIQYMKEAASIASFAHEKAMRDSRPGMGEWEIQALVEGHFMSSLSQWSFPSIVGGGDLSLIHI